MSLSEDVRLHQDVVRLMHAQRTGPPADTVLLPTSGLRRLLRIAVGMPRDLWPVGFDMRDALEWQRRKSARRARMARKHRRGFA